MSQLEMSPVTRPDHRVLPPLAYRPVLAALLVAGAVLSAFSGQYGYHRDELYFRLLHPAWGYVDQPPLTPLLARLFSNLIADQAWAIRIPATLAVLASAYVLVLITREVCGGRAAQTLCAWGYCFGSIPLIMGHALLTSTIDLPCWPLVLLLAIRAQLRAQPRWWLAAGLVAGLSTYNKLLIAVLLVALAGGIAIAGPRRLLRSPWVLGAVAIMLVVSAPNVIYQATHHWPQLTMGRALAAHNAGSVRIVMWPFLLLLLGPPLVPIWLAGLTALVRRPGWRPVRWLAAALPVLLVLVCVMGSQQYYPFGLIAVLFAIGCVPAADWAARAGLGRRAWLVAAVAVNAAVTLVLGLPLIPLSALGDSPVPAVNQVAADSVGWPTYVAEVAAVYQALPATDQAATVIVASNYGEAGAVDRYGPRYRLPKVYSGQNQLYFVGHPPASATVAIIVGGQGGRAAGLFASCRQAGRLDNRLGVDNEEQDEPILVCEQPVGGWDAIWPRLQHYD